QAGGGQCALASAGCRGRGGLTEEHGTHAMMHDGRSAVPPRPATTKVPGPAVPAVDALTRLSTALGVADPWSRAARGRELETQVLASGTVLFREGDPSDAMYMVLSGDLRATVTDPQHGDMVVGHIGPGEPVGEMQVLSGGTRTATVVATTDTE